MAEIKITRSYKVSKKEYEKFVKKAKKNGTRPSTLINAFIEEYNKNTK